jgi:hypothetical protein
VAKAEALWCRSDVFAFVGWDEIPAFIGMAMLGFHPSLQNLHA